MNDLESQTWGRWREGHGEEARVAMFLRTLSKREKTYLLMEERQSTGNVSGLVLLKACFHPSGCDESGEVFYQVAPGLPTIASSVYPHLRTHQGPPIAQPAVLGHFSILKHPLMLSCNRLGFPVKVLLLPALLHVYYSGSST